MAFKALLNAKTALLLGFAQVVFTIIVKKKKPELAPTKTQLRVLSIIDQYAIACMGTSTICPHSIKSSLASLYPYMIKLFQALSHFPVLQGTESWAGPGNKAKHILFRTHKPLLLSMWPGLPFQLTGLQPSIGGYTLLL